MSAIKEAETSDRVFKGKFPGLVKMNKAAIKRNNMPAYNEMHPKVLAMLKRPRHSFKTKETQGLRSLSLTATDWNTIVHKLPIRGENKYRNLNKLFRKKLGMDPFKGNRACDHGVYYEPEALRVYEQVTGNELVKDEIGFCRGPPIDHQQEDYIMPEFVGATPDGVCKYRPILIETKCPYWKQVISGGVPDIYWSQLMVQMAVTGIHICHFVRYLPPSFAGIGEINIIEVKFDREWWKIAVPEGIKVHNKLIQMLRNEVERPRPPQKRTKKSLGELKYKCLI